MDGCALYKNRKVLRSAFSLHIYSCAGCETKITIWTLVGSRDNQRIVAIADLKVQLFYCRNPPLNAHTSRQLIYCIFSCSYYISVHQMASHRDAVDVKGLDQVALSDGIPQCAIQSLIRVNGCYCGDGCTHCVRSLT